MQPEARTDTVVHIHGRMSASDAQAVSFGADDRSLKGRDRKNVVADGVASPGPQ